MKPVARWDTPRIAIYGLLIGAAFSAFKVMTDDQSPPFIIDLARMFGGGVGGAAIFAIVSGVRNVMVGAR